jgi:hypothetical protein
MTNHQPQKPDGMQWDEWTVVRMELLLGLLSDILTPAKTAVTALDAQLQSLALMKPRSAPQIIGALDHLIGLVGAVDENLREVREQLAAIKSTGEGNKR